MTKINIIGRNKAVTIIQIHTDEGKFVGQVRVHGDAVDFAIPTKGTLIVQAV